ncbi:MAG TPA: hypothetical protein VG406_06800 [Isosphaeraceae bacterium]|jgi:hypothetical protein|nr:hypothetical protein [Isosphaeraceae bacterium]
MTHMRFDVDRTMAHVRALDSARPAGSEAERRAADSVAQHLQDSGLSVERREAVGSLFPELIGERVGWLGLGVTATIAILSTSKFAHEVSSLATFALAAAFATGLFRWLGRGLPPRIRTPIVLATRPGAESPRARVLLLTHLDTNPPGWAARMRAQWDIFFLWMLTWSNVGDPDRPDLGWRWFDLYVLPTLLFLAGLLVSYVVYRPSRRSGNDLLDQRRGYLLAFAFVGSSVVVAVMSRVGLEAWAMPVTMVSWVWLAVLVRGWPLFTARYALQDAENRTGLALLIELARAWPVDAKEGLDVAFAAVGARTAGQAGARELARIVAEDWPGRPTLVISVQSPGYGNQIVLSGTEGPLWLAQTAARDLWIPHRESNWSPIPKGHAPFARRRIDAVSLAGAIELTSWSPKPEDLFQSAMLGTTAQLARELALRWARRAK